MRIVVCIKQVPQDADVRIDQRRWTLVREGVPSCINPHDLLALETAFVLRERHRGEVLVLSMGPPQSEESLREAIAMGADEAILLTAPQMAGADTLATSKVLARAIEILEPSPALILCGTRSTDSDTGQVGPQVAEALDIPHVAYVEEVEIEGTKAMVKRVLDRQRQTLKVGLPVLLTILRSPRPPSDISLWRIEDAFEPQKVRKWGLEELRLRPEEVGLQGSATVVRSIRRPETQRRGKLLQCTPTEAVECILEALRERYLLEEAKDLGEHTM
jgi:electron transfer flavoprotein beta subunit